MAGPVPVVEQVLHLRIVHVDRGEEQRPGAGERPKSSDPRGRLFSRAPDLTSVLARAVDERDQVGAVIDDDVRVGLEHRPDPVPIGGHGLPLLGARVDPGLAERRHGIVVGRERVAGREADIGASRLEREGERGRLRLDVEDRRDREAPERVGGLEAVPDPFQDRHVGTRPLDLLTPTLEVARHTLQASVSRDGIRAREGGKGSSERPAGPAYWTTEEQNGQIR